MQTLTLLLLAFIIISHIMDGCSQSSKSAQLPYTAGTLAKMDTLLWRKQGEKEQERCKLTDCLAN